MPPIHIKILHPFHMTLHIHYAKKVWVMQKEEKISVLKEHEKKEKEKERKIAHIPRKK
jgi:hypothetical protein